MSHLRSGYLLQGRYSIQRVLGQGGFGITYLAFDVALDIEVCVKELYVSGQCTRRDGVQVETGGGAGVDFVDFVVRFMDEARSLARFDHAGIVGVRDVFEGNGTAYLVMEYVVGETLKGRVEREGAFSESEALVVFKQLVSAVEEVHGRGMLHRDIKPENVMLTSGGRVVLIDFGTAREFAEGRTSTHSVMLTPGYAPPEQYSMRAQRGTFTDVYALGATLYFLLTGEKPLAAPERHIETLESPSKLTEGKVSDRVSEAVMRAMAIRPGDRFQTVGEMRAGLEGASKLREGRVPVSIGDAEVARKSGNRKVWLLGFGMVLFAVGLVWLGRENSAGNESSARQDSPTEMETAEAQDVVQDIDGNVYRTVPIGNQVWMAENLQTTRYRNEDNIPGNLNNDQWTNTTSGAQAVYENNSSNLSTYGRLYNWYAVKDSRGLCPAGWHVPSDAEWKELEMALGMAPGEANEAGDRGTDQGAQLKMPSWGGTNSSGFSALPGGFRFYGNGDFDYQGSDGYWWSSSPTGSSAWRRGLGSGYSNVYRYNASARFGFSVRCVRD